MKIVCLLSSNVRGGGETYVRSLALGVQAQGGTFQIIGSVPSEVAVGLTTSSIPIGPKWSRRTAIRSLTSAVSERSKYLKQARATNADVFHCQYKREQILLSKSLSRLGPVVWTEHGDFMGGFAGWVLGLFYRFACRNVSTVICVSDAVKDSLIERVGIDPEKLEVIENSVDSRFFTSDYTVKATDLTRRLSEGLPIRLISVSRLVHSKGVDRAIEALEYLPSGFQLVVVGEGPMSDDLKVKAAKFGDRVEFLGYLPDTQSAFASADIFLCMSRPEAREGIPISILEAAAGGLNLLVSIDSGLKAWCDTNRVPTVVPDPQQIASAVRAICADPFPGSAVSMELATGRRSLSWLKQHLSVFGAASS